MYHPESYHQAHGAVKDALLAAVPIGPDADVEQKTVRLENASRVADILIQDTYVLGAAKVVNVRDLRVVLTDDTRPGPSLAAFGTLRACKEAVEGLERVYEGPNKVLAAAERVRAFLAERRRAQLGNGYDQTIYSLGTPGGDIVDLLHNDLDALVRAVLPDADLGAMDPRIAAAQEWRRVRRNPLDGIDLFAAERRSIERQEREDGTGE